MSVYDTSYATKEELIQALDSSIQESKNEDGTSTFSLQNDLADKYYAEVQNAKKQRQEKQEAQRRNEALQAELDQFRALNADDSKPATPQAYLDKMKTIEEKLAKLESENNQYRERETRTKINAKLNEIAENVGIDKSAIKDVAAIYGSRFRLTEDGKLREIGSDVDATEIMRKALEDRPYWNQKSKGGGASSSVGGVQDSRAKFLDAMGRNDFASVFANAPTLD